MRSAISTARAQGSRHSSRGAQKLPCCSSTQDPSTPCPFELRSPRSHSGVAPSRARRLNLAFSCRARRGTAELFDVGGRAWSTRAPFPGGGPTPDLRSIPRFRQACLDAASRIAKPRGQCGWSPIAMRARDRGGGTAGHSPRTGARTPERALRRRAAGTLNRGQSVVQSRRSRPGLAFGVISARPHRQRRRDRCRIAATLARWQRPIAVCSAADRGAMHPASPPTRARSPGRAARCRTSTRQRSTPRRTGLRRAIRAGASSENAALLRRLEASASLSRAHCRRYSCEGASSRRVRGGRGGRCRVPGAKARR